MRDVYSGRRNKLGGGYRSAGVEGRLSGPYADLRSEARGRPRVRRAIVTRLLSGVVPPHLASVSEVDTMRRMTPIAMLGLGLVLAGCGVIPGIGPDPRIEATPVATVVCPEIFEEGYAEAGLVPPGFMAVAVLRCDPYASREDGDGTWSGALLQRLEGDLEPVITALTSPSDARSLGACAANGYVTPELWVEGADGRVVRVAVPSDGCGAPKDMAWRRPLTR